MLVSGQDYAKTEGLKTVGFGIVLAKKLGQSLQRSDILLFMGGSQRRRRNGRV